MTELDVEIAAMLYPVLVDVARKKELVPFGELIRRTQSKNPQNAAIQRQVSVGVGRRLAAVRVFTKSKGYPDLTCLVVRPGKDVPPDNYFGDPYAEQARVAAFDWDKVDGEFSIQVAMWRQENQKRKKRKREEAVAIMAAHYREQQASLPASIREFREQIIASLMAGENVLDAFEAVISDMAAGSKN